MAIEVRGPGSDMVLQQIEGVLAEFGHAHPAAKIDAYRYDPVSVRIRVVDRSFSGRSRSQREEELWTRLAALRDDITAEISLLLLLTPEEVRLSAANREFDNPAHSAPD